MKPFLFCLSFLLLSLPVLAQTQSTNGVYWTGGGTVNPANYRPQQLNSILDSGSVTTLRTTPHLFDQVVTPTVTSTAAYSAGLEIGPLENITVFRGGTNAALNGAGATFRSIFVADTSAPSGHYPISFYIFNTGTAALTGTYSDFQKPAFTASDLSHLVHTYPVAFSAYVAPGGVVTGGTNIFADILGNTEGLGASGSTGALTILPVVTGTGAALSGTNVIRFEYAGEIN